jgi:hypothetical protein
VYDPSYATPPWQLYGIAIDCLNGRVFNPASAHFDLYHWTLGSTLDLGNTFKCALFGAGSNCLDVENVTKFADLSHELPPSDGYVSGGVEMPDAKLAPDKEGDFAFTATMPRFVSTEGPLGAQYAVVYFDQPDVGDMLLCVRTLDTDDTQATTDGYVLTIKTRPDLFNLGHWVDANGETYTPRRLRGGVGNLGMAAA